MTSAFSPFFSTSIILSPTFIYGDVKNRKYFFFQEAGTKELIEEKEENELDPLPSPEKFYDRSKSFFDNISCEAMGPKQDEQEYGDVVSARTLFFDIKKIK